MNDTIKFTIFQKATGKATVHYTRSGIAYHTKSQKLNEQVLMAEMLPFRPPKPITDPVELYVYAYFAVPASKPKWWQDAALEGRIQYDKKPDGDNILKMLGDCLQKLQFIKNDSQIYYCTIIKEYSENACINITLVTEKNVTKQEWDIIRKAKP